MIDYKPRKVDVIYWHRTLALYAKNEVGFDDIELREYMKMDIRPHHVFKGKGSHFAAVNELIKVLARHYPTQYLTRLKENKR